MSMIMRPNSEDEVIAKVESEIDIKVLYRLNLFILVNNHTKNLLFCNLADVLANFFGDLFLTSINVYFYSAFSVFSSHFATFDSISGPKPLNFISLGGPTTYNSNNILAFYH